MLSQSYHQIPGTKIYGSWNGGLIPGTGNSKFFTKLHGLDRESPPVTAPASASVTAQVRDRESCDRGRFGVHEGEAESCTALNPVN